MPGGRDDRTVIVVDSERTASAEAPTSSSASLPRSGSRRSGRYGALLRGVTLDPERVETATGLGWEVLADLADRLRRARYGAWFGDAVRDVAENEAALALVRDLNAHTRFVILSLGGPGNATGAEAVLTWQTGYSGRVDLAGGVPRFEPGAAAAVSMLERGEADAALIVGDDVEAILAEPVRDRLSRIPAHRDRPGATAPAGARPWRWPQRRVGSIPAGP